MHPEVKDEVENAWPSREGVIVRLTEAAALLNLRAVLQCAAGRLRCSEKTHRPSAASVGVVAAGLVDGDFSDQEPIAAFAWPLLLQAGGLAELAGGAASAHGARPGRSHGVCRRDHPQAVVSLAQPGRDR